MTPLLLAALATAGALLVVAPAVVARPAPIPTAAPRTARCHVRHRASRTVLSAMAAALLVDPLLAASIGALCVAVPRLRTIRSRRRTADRRSGDLVVLADHLVVGVGAGLTLPLALRACLAHARPTVGPAVERAVEGMDRGLPAAVALEGLGHDWGAEGRVLADVLIDHARYGTALLPGLQRAVDHLDRAHRQRVETRLRRLPITLLFPLVGCTLPAFGLLTVAPVVAATLQSLSGAAFEDPSSTPTTSLEEPSCTEPSSWSTWPPCP